MNPCPFCKQPITADVEAHLIRYYDDEVRYNVCRPCAIREAQEFDPKQTDTFLVDGVTVERWRLENPTE